MASRTIWSAVVSDGKFPEPELHRLWRNRGPDRNRFFVGPSVSLGKAVFVEIGYLNQYAFRSNAPDKHDHLLATNLFWSFDPRSGAATRNDPGRHFSPSPSVKSYPALNTITQARCGSLFGAARRRLHIAIQVSERRVVEAGPIEQIGAGSGDGMAVQPDVHELS